MTAKPTHIDGVENGRNAKFEGDCPDAQCSETDQQMAPDGRQKREQWLQDNRQAIQRYNERVLEQGVFSDGVRCF